MKSQGATLDNLPPFVTVVQAARVLSISRTAAYALANRWLATDGAEGLPVIRLGRTMRVPRAALQRYQDIDVTAV